MLKLTDTCVWPGEILYFDLDTLRHFRACADGAIVAIDAFGTLERTKLTEPVIGAFWAQAVWTNQLVTLNSFIRWWIQQFQQEAPLLADIYPTKVVNGWVKLLAEYDKRFSNAGVARTPHYACRHSRESHPTNQPDQRVHASRRGLRRQALPPRLERFCHRTWRVLPR